MKGIVAIALASALTVSAAARIGENRHQIIARLGEPESYGQGGSTNHLKNGYLIMVKYDKGIASSITYIRQATMADDPVPMTDEEKIVLMKNNSSEPWKQTEPNKWETDSLYATYLPSACLLQIVMRQFLQDIQERDEAKRIKDASGL